jgi:hypothetical protein
MMILRAATWVSGRRPFSGARSGGQEVIPAMAGGWYEDQVERCRRFSTAHPEVRIELRRESWTWEATYPVSGNGVEAVTGSELRHVLDRLENVYPEYREGGTGHDTR